MTRDDAPLRPEVSASDSEQSDRSRAVLESKCILLLTPQFPYPAHQGTTLRNYNLIVGLTRRHEVHLLSFGDPVASQATPLHTLCASVQIVPVPQRTTSQRLKGLFLSRLPDMAQRLPSAQFQTTLSESLKRLDPDVVEVEGIELAKYLFQVVEERGERDRPLVVFDDHNAEYVLQQRAFETDSGQLRHISRAWPRRLVGATYSLVQWRRLTGYERRACLAADRVVAVSDADAGALHKQIPGLEPVVVPNGVDVKLYGAALSPDDLPAGYGDKDLVFTGKMDFRPNVDAVLWFAQEVLPLIVAEEPGARLWIVGKDPHPRLAPLAGNPAVTVTGWVDDVRPYIAAAAIYVIPLRIGGGTRLKVLEAMAMGKAIVSTTLGCEGFDIRSGDELVTADTPAEFAAAVLALLRDSARRAELGRSAHAFAAQNYDWPMIVPLLEQVYEPDFNPTE
jgi:glycosyltransferase involved in cell wall biosynthesis